MKNNISISGVLLMLFLFLHYQSVAQDKPGILHLKDNKYNSYFNLGFHLEDDLLTNGNNGEATIEFWVRSLQPGNAWSLTDLATGNSGIKLEMFGENQLKFADNEVIDLGTDVQTGKWHHVALTVQNGKAALYVGGRIVGFNYDYTPQYSSQELCIYKSANSEIMITEVRGWSITRTPEEIANNQWRSFIFNSDFELNDLKYDEGLEVLYGNNEVVMVDSDILPVQRLSWKSLSNDSNELLASDAIGISETDLSGVLMSISDQIDHPVLSNRHIFLKASQGQFEDRIVLEWPHVMGKEQNIDQYHSECSNKCIGGNSLRR